VVVVLKGGMELHTGAHVGAGGFFTGIQFNQPIKMEQDVDINGDLRLNGASVLTTADTPLNISGGNSSIAFGLNTSASGLYSTTFGNSTLNSQFAGVSVGQYNENIGTNSGINSWQGDDLHSVFEVGVGISQNERENALTVKQDGSVELGKTINNEIPMTVGADGSIILNGPVILHISHNYMKKSIYLIFGLFLLLFNSLKAGDPYWWQEHGLNNSNESNDEALATIGQLKHVVDKTIDYLEVALVDNGGAGTEVLALRNQSWFTSTSNSKIVPTIGQLKYVMAPIYDRLRDAYPSEYVPLNPNAQPASWRGIDPAWNTRWMADISPFYSHEELSTALVLPRVPLLGSTPRTGVYSAVSHYPWTEQLEDNKDTSLLTLGQLKFACSFETPASFDSGTVTTTQYHSNRNLTVYIPSNIQAEERLPLYIHLSGSEGTGSTSTTLPNWVSQGKNRAYAIYIGSLSSRVESSFTIMEGVIDSFIEEHQVDPNRIYFSGFSLGGSVLMDFLHRRPDLITVAWFIEPANPDFFRLPTLKGLNIINCFMRMMFLFYIVAILGPMELALILLDMIEDTTDIYLVFLRTIN